MNQVLAGQDLQRGLVKHPLRHECTVTAMGSRHAQPCGKLVVHQDGEGTVAIVERAEAVRNACHLVAADAVAGSEQRLRIDMRIAAEKIRVL